MSRTNIKRICAAACAAAMMSSLAACGENTTWGAQIDGVQIPAGIFIYYLNSAYYDAQTRINEEDAAAAEDASAADTSAAAESVDIFTRRLDGKSVKQWIYDEATAMMQEYAAVETKFDEYGLALTSEQQESAQLYCDQLWDYGGEYYTQMGISERSYRSIYLNTEKRDMLFGELYSEGGEYGVADDEIRSYLDENYVMINYIEMELRDGEGNLLKSDGKAERMAMAEEYLQRYENGEDFDLLNAEYVTYYENLIAEAEAAAAEAAAEDTLTAEVSGSDAEAALIGEGDVLTESENVAEEEPVTEEAAADDTAAADEDETDTPAKEADEELADGGSGSDGEGAADTDNGSTADEAPETDNSDVAVNAVASNRTVVERESTSPAAEVVSAVFDEMEKGEARIIESTNGEYYYLVLKMDIIETDEYLETAKDSLLYEMRSEDYDALISQWTQGQSVARNADAYDRYDPEKIFAN